MAQIHRESYPELLEAARSELVRIDGWGLPEPEDLVSRAVVKLLAGGACCERPDRMFAFLKGVIRNLVRDLRKRPAVAANRSLEEGEPKRPVASSASDDPFLAAVRAERLKRAAELLDAVLSRRQREVYVMKERWGASIANIAEDLGITPGTVKVHLRDARRRLLETRR